ncbi:MAG: hypothetical protein JNM86_04720 [Phycisphaerae bacterium]|nr:hypothetical protein [Phycisphaerae bacterium]
MQIRFYIDPETGRPHVENHGVTVDECVQVLGNASQDFPGVNGARIAYGATNAGRLLKVIYRLDDDGDGLFVITAYPLRGKEQKAYRRRKRGRARE